MNEYQQQIEAGKSIVLEILTHVALELEEPRIAELKFAVTSRDFDYDQVSLIDSTGNVVTKLEETDLADCPADKRVRAKLQAQLFRSMRAFYAPKK